MGLLRGQMITTERLINWWKYDDRGGESHRRGRRLVTAKEPTQVQSAWQDRSDAGTSSAGLPSKNPLGFRWKPT
jgi:hypothetical protein